MTTARDRARLCVNLPLLLRDAPGEAFDLAVALEAGREIGDGLTALLERVGIPEDARPVRGVPKLPLAAAPAADVYVCPAGPDGGPCDRVVGRRIGVPTPRCALRGVPMCPGPGRP